jgi:hypothetical protein
MINKVAALALAGSILLCPIAYAKHASFDMPVCEKLLDGDGPSSRAAAAPPSNKPSSKDLTPMKLTDDSKSFTVGEDGKVKIEVQQNNVIQPGEPTLADPTAKVSVVGKDKKLGDKVLKGKEKGVDVSPIAIRESEEEAQQKQDTISDAEKEQLSDLWNATINRSPDIQFVINKLQPHSDGAHATATALKLIGGALFNIVQVAPLMMPGGVNMGSYALSSGGASILQGLMSEGNARAAKKQAISQEQATMLYKIVRDTAEKVVVEYRKYRQNRSEFQRATTDLEDLKSMVATASRTASPDVAISMEYTIRKAQRDVEKIIDEAKLHKQQLVDLAGAEAIARLDGQMDKEAEMLNMLIAAPPKDADQSGFKNPLQKPLNEDNVQKPQFADNKDKKGLQL